LPRQGLRLPSLEWLQRFNREALWTSTICLAIGLLCGIVLNFLRGADGVLWNDPVVISSGVLFLWLVAVTVFESFYKPARQGRKVAYLTMASFVFLGLALLFVLFGGHGIRSREGNGGPQAAAAWEAVVQADPPRGQDRAGGRP
jgi:hypothetical protein